MLTKEQIDCIRRIGRNEGGVATMFQDEMDALCDTAELAHNYKDQAEKSHLDHETTKLQLANVEADHRAMTERLVARADGARIGRDIIAALQNFKGHAAIQFLLLGLDEVLTQMSVKSPLLTAKDRE